MQRPVFLSLAVLLGCTSSMAMAQSRADVSVDISVGGSVSSNPFLLVDDETAGGFSLEIDPTIYLEDGVNETIISANLRLTEFTNDFGTDEAARVGIASTYQLDNRTSIDAGGSFLTSRSAVQDTVRLRAGGPPPTSPDPEPVIPIIDPTIAGTRIRVNSFAGNVGLSHAVDALSTLSAGVSTGYTDFGDGGGFDFTSVTPQLAYSRRLSEETTVAISGQFSRIDYSDTPVGDAIIVTPQVQIIQRLNDKLELTVGAGISYTDIDTGPDTSIEDVAFTGTLGLCNRGQQGTLCLSGARTVQPTALGGVTNVTTVAATYDLRLSQKDRLSFAGSYGRTDQSVNAAFPLAGDDTDVVAASVRYSRELNQRLSFFIAPSFADIGSNVLPRDPNYSIKAGITLRLGRNR